MWQRDGLALWELGRAWLPALQAAVSVASAAGRAAALGSPLLSVALGLALGGVLLAPRLTGRSRGRVFPADGQRKAPMPVMASPMASVWISSVPS